MLLRQGVDELVQRFPYLNLVGSKNEMVCVWNPNQTRLRIALGESIGLR